MNKINAICLFAAEDDRDIAADCLYCESCCDWAPTTRTPLSALPVKAQGKAGPVVPSKNNPMRYDVAALDQRTAAGIWELPKHPEFKVSFADHRGRVFDRDFFVAGGDSNPGLYVWGHSRSGATRIIAWPARSKKGRRGYSPTRHYGWTKEASAALVAAAISEALQYVQAARDRLPKANSM